MAETEKRQQLADMYWGQKLSVRDIAKVLGIPSRTLYATLERFNIDRRSRSDAGKVMAQNHPASLGQRQAIRKALLGRTQSPETIARRALSLKRHYRALPKIPKPKISRVNWGRCCEWSLEIKEGRQRLVHLYCEQRLSGREIAKMLSMPIPTVFSLLKRYEISRSRSESAKLARQKHPITLEQRQSISRYLTGKKQSAETRAKRVASRKGYRHSEETKAKMSRSNKGKHKWTAEMRDRILPLQFKGRKVRPTKPERRFQEIIDKYGLPYKYVGNGYTWIAGRCPDFLNVNGKKEVVEIFGRYWHDSSLNQKVRPQDTEANTLAHYAKYGFRCVIFWEDELSSDEAVLERIGP